MEGNHPLTEDRVKFLQLLAEKYPSRQAANTEIINLQSILNLPKGTEHFVSDIHGEYEAFSHILNNCSGVIREKVALVFKDTRSPAEQSELCTLIYYPREKLERLRDYGLCTAAWYEQTLGDLIDLAKLLSSKYTRANVKRALPDEYSFIIDELLHAQPDEDNNQLVYHRKIIETIIQIDSGDDFILALAALIKRLAVDRLHIVGDIFDRGAHPDRIIDLLMGYHSLDIEWGNHDILWMGAASGSDACIAAVVRNNIHYGNMEILESGYGISLRPLSLFARETYGEMEISAAATKAITVIMLKLEGQIIRRHPEYAMDDRLLLGRMDHENHTIDIEGRVYIMEDTDFPTVDPADPYALSPAERQVLEALRDAFEHSERLHAQIDFLYHRGGMYRAYNGNLLFHGCIPLDAEGNFEGISFGGPTMHGKAYMDYADRRARQAYYGDRAQDDLDFMWYLWCGLKSPLAGRIIKTFERAFIADRQAWVEPQNPYYAYCNTEQTCNMILREFGLYGPSSHIINGHTPVKVIKGDSPIRAGGKLLIIDGGFCRAYQKTTGIAGYTLIFNSHGMRIKAHSGFSSVADVLAQNDDIQSETDIFETEPRRLMVMDTDDGKKIEARVADLHALVAAYRDGSVRPSSAPR
ncbi:fructose-1,6-bisphosphatase [Eubacteriales bacterium OttesenSCG-928-A19]|nr:fructose-1,6-bisphosphatase [Eubacteriales bacterium OttesenSCG-928-A19]